MDIRKGLLFTIVSVVVLALSFLLPACQPTPESNCHHEAPPSYGIEAESPDLEEVNHYKNTNATWEEEFTGKSDSLTIRVNAVLPIGIDNIKKQYIAQSLHFDREDVIRLSHAIWGDKTIYANTSDILTKNEIMEIILRLEGQEVSESNSAFSGAAGIAGADTSSQLSSFRQMYANAPDERKCIETDYSFADIAGITGLSFADLMTIDSDGTVSTLTVINDVHFMDTSVEYVRDAIHTNYIDRAATYGDAPRGVEVSQENAVDEAKQFLKTLGLDDFHYVTSKYWTNAPLGVNINSSYYTDEANQCYALYFTREINKLPVNMVFDYDSPKSEGYDGAAYAPLWQGEYIIICVDQQGIAYMKWVNPTNITPTENTAELLNWEELKQCFKKAVSIINIDVGNSSNESVQTFIEIDSINLGYAYTRIPNQTGTYKLSPVVDFIGKRYSTYTNKQGISVTSNTTSADHSFVTINVENGNIIDRGVGY